MAAPPLHALPVADARALVRAMADMSDARDMPIAQVEDRTIPGPGGSIPVRVCTPEGRGARPLLVYFHGGGWVLGDRGTHDGVCRELAHGAGCIVMSVDYRLAPEHKFPAAADDCYAALVWAAANAAALVAFAVERFGGLDVMHNNAAWTGGGYVHEIEPAIWDRSIQVMLTGVFYGMKAAIPAMLARGDESSAVTGTAIVVDGGLISKSPISGFPPYGE